MAYLFLWKNQEKAINEYVLKIFFMQDIRVIFWRNKVHN